MEWWKLGSLVEVLKLASVKLGRYRHPGLSNLGDVEASMSILLTLTCYLVLNSENVSHLNK